MSALDTATILIERWAERLSARACMEIGPDRFEDLAKLVAAAVQDAYKRGVEEGQRPTGREHEAIVLWLHVVNARLKGPEYLGHDAREHMAGLVTKAIRFIESAFGVARVADLRSPLDAGAPSLPLTEEGAAR